MTADTTPVDQTGQAWSRPLAPTATEEAMRETARRADDPFRASVKFGPTGQYRQCDMCSGRFESRGLKLCPDCYEIRKTQPGFDDDKRFTSAAGRVTFEHRICLWCSAPIEVFRDGRKVRANVQFCQTTHAQAYRRASPNSAKPGPSGYAICGPE